jgi:hypothetical protein
MQMDGYSFSQITGSSDGMMVERSPARRWMGDQTGKYSVKSFPVSKARGGGLPTVKMNFGCTDFRKKRLNNSSKLRSNPTMKTQTELILRDLMRGWKITPLQALKRYGSFRLGARIHNLKKQGYPIETEIVNVGGKRVARYRMEKWFIQRHRALPEYPLDALLSFTNDLAISA